MSRRTARRRRVLRALDLPAWPALLLRVSMITLLLWQASPAPLRLF